MSPFIIFTIVLTIAYILYYATLITMDLKAKSKEAEKDNEIISADDDEEYDSGIISRNVVEDTVSGGFNISEPSDNNIIEEETDHQENISSEDISEVPSASIPANEEEGDIAESADESQDDDSISTIPFAGTTPEEDGKEKPFEETDAFNPDLAQPQFGVSAIVGNPVDAAVQKSVDDINRILITNTKPKGNLTTPEEFASVIQANRKNSNIEHHDEYTQC